MERVRFALLRGVCQMPAYVAYEKGYFREEQIDARLEIQPTAWIIPRQLAEREVEFAVIPWTRVATAQSRGEDLVVICGSGCEEAALVVRAGLQINAVQCVALPQEGGMKDLTAMALLESLGWDRQKLLRMPSGDAAILSLIGRAADAASMVEPYASMLEALHLGRVVRRTGDIWPGAPGCSLTTSRAICEEEPELTQKVVAAFVRGAEFIQACPEESAQISARYIGISAEIILRALEKNRPQIGALYNRAAMQKILDLMLGLGYVSERPSGFAELGFLESVAGEQIVSI